MAFGIKWLKPELDEPKYYFHVLILIVSFVLIMKYVFGYSSIPTDITFDLIWKGMVALTISDGIAHTLLQMD